MNNFCLIPYQKPEFIDSIGGRVILSKRNNKATRQIEIIFDLKGNLKHLTWPQAKPNPKRLDYLWQSTCFELFISQANNATYREFNFSPSGSWQSYQFSAYRKDQEICKDLILIDSHIQKSDKQASIHITLEYGIERSSTNLVTFDIGISVILKDIFDHHHYYALAHGEDKPDFHNTKYHLLQLAS